MAYSQKTLDEFKDFAEDHLKAFDAIPMHFENSEGEEFYEDECWEMANQLGLISRED